MTRFCYIFSFPSFCPLFSYLLCTRNFPFICVRLHLLWCIICHLEFGIANWIDIRGNAKFFTVSIIFNLSLSYSHPHSLSLFLSTYYVLSKCLLHSMKDHWCIELCISDVNFIWAAWHHFKSGAMSSWIGKRKRWEERERERHKTHSMKILKQHVLLLLIFLEEQKSYIFTWIHLLITTTTITRTTIIIKTQSLCILMNSLFSPFNFQKK